MMMMRERVTLIDSASNCAGGIRVFCCRNFSIVDCDLQETIGEIENGKNKSSFTSYFVVEEYVQKLAIEQIPMFVIDP